MKQVQVGVVSSWAAAEALALPSPLQFSCHFVSNLLWRHGGCRSIRKMSQRGSWQWESECDLVQSSLIQNPI